MERDMKALRPKHMKKLRWCCDSKSSEYMRMRKEQNLARALTNKNENWMADLLATTGLKWTRQAQWGYRRFDFWCAHLGVAVEVDGAEHREDYDAYRDEYNFRRSGIIVLRVRNLSAEDAAAALEAIGKQSPWKERRVAMGLNTGSKKARRKWVTAPSLI